MYFGRVIGSVVATHGIEGLAGNRLLLIEKTDISEQDIKSKITEIDLRDGTKDGKYDAKAAAPPAKDCPKCDAKISRDFNRCLFCGYQDQEAQSNVW